MKGITYFHRHPVAARLLCVFATAALLTNSVAPAIGATLRNRHQGVSKPGPKVPVMKGVPRMDLSKQGVAPRPVAPSLSKLDDRAKLMQPVTAADLARWRAAAATPGKSRAKACANIWLGEEALAAREQPVEAEGYFNKALAAAPAKSREHGLAAVDHGLSTLYQGKYAVAEGEFDHILRVRSAGVDRKRVAILLTH